MAEIKGIIFDLGEVIFTTDDSVLERHSIAKGMHEKAFMDLLNDYFDGAHQGDYDSLEHYFEVRNPQFGIRLHEMKTAFAEWETTTTTDKQIIDYIAELKKRGYALGLLSNFDVGIEYYLEEEFKIDHLFDVIVSSYNVKMKKPNPEIYRYILSEMGLKPEEVVFTDDNINNIRGAEAVGIKAIHYKNHKTFFPEFKTELEVLLKE